MRIRIVQFGALGLLLLLAIGCASAAAQPIPDGVYTSRDGIVDLRLAKGSWFITHGPFAHVEEGTYAFSGNQIRFELVKQDLADECSATQKTFSYQWTTSGKSITLTKLDDSCSIRMSDLTGGPLALKDASQ